MFLKRPDCPKDCCFRGSEKCHTVKCRTYVVQQAWYAARRQKRHEQSELIGFLVSDRARITAMKGSAS